MPDSGLPVAPWRIACALGLAFTAFFAATTRGTLVFGDDLMYFRVTQAIAERGDFDVSTGAVGDVPERTIPGRGGLRYAKYGLGLSLVSVPAYVVGRWIEGAGFRLPVIEDSNGRARTGTRVFLVGLTNAVVGALAALATMWLALELGCGLAPAVAVAALLGGATFFAHYATVFLSEALSTLALTAAVAGALRTASHLAAPGGRRATLAAAASGAAAGLALVTRIAHAVAVAAIGAWLIVAFLRALRAPAERGAARRWLVALGVWGTGVVLGLLAVAAFNLWRFGDLFETGYGSEARRFTVPLADGLAGLIASPGRGLLWYAPPLWLALVGWGRLARRRPWQAALLALVFWSVALLFARYYMWWGGGSWGPRFLVPVLPIALAPAALAVPGSLRRSRLAAIGWTFATVAGVVVATLPLVVPFEHYLREPSRAELRAQAVTPARIFWRLEDSPLVAVAREAPAAAARTLRLLTGFERLPAPGAWEAEMPDLAFAWYRSSALLWWTRVGLLAAALGGLATIRRFRHATAAPDARDGS